MFIVLVSGSLLIAHYFPSFLSRLFSVSSFFVFVLYFVSFFLSSLTLSPPLCVFPWSALPTHSLVCCNTLHHPVQLEGMFFFFFFFCVFLCFSLHSLCLSVYLHGVWFTAGSLYNFQTVSVVCSADIKMKQNRKFLILTAGVYFLCS